MKRPDGDSSYTLDLAAKASHALRDVRGGTDVFVQQPEPASAAGVSQKPMYLACDWWRARGVLAGIRVVFLSPEPAAFGIPAISSELQRALDAYGIESRFSVRLREVRTGEVVIEQDGRTEVLAYDLLHAAPPQSPPAPPGTGRSLVVSPDPQQGWRTRAHAPALTPALDRAPA